MLVYWMLRVTTKVTVSPTRRRRTWSAAAHTASTSSPRAVNRISASSRVGLSPPTALARISVSPGRTARMRAKAASTEWAPGLGSAPTTATRPAASTAATSDGWHRAAVAPWARSTTASAPWGRTTRWEKVTVSWRTTTDQDPFRLLGILGAGGEAVGIGERGHVAGHLGGDPPPVMDVRRVDAQTLPEHAAERRSGATEVGDGGPG